MTTPSPAERRRDEFEAWWPLIARIAGFFMGCGILAFETVLSNSDRPWLIAGAITLMGPTAVPIIENVLRRLPELGQEPPVQEPGSNERRRQSRRGRR